MKKNNELRNIEIIPNFSKNADGSCLIKAGNTHVICTATFDSKVPPFLRNQNQGWVTAEYGMLPASTNGRMQREAAKGKQSGRTMEIQRLIGRSLRSVVDFKAMGENQVIIDCDVIQADGGTRTASITGGYIAMCLAFAKAYKNKLIHKIPVFEQVAAISCGIYDGKIILDLDYEQDSNAQVDANFVMTGKGDIVEIQSTAEGKAFSEKDFFNMLESAKKGIAELIEIQKSILEEFCWKI